MCGINGFNSENKGLIEKMCACTTHRGPDQTRVWVGNGVSLGHNRLAIIDLSERGAQPMWDARQEIGIVFNGEIYNFKTLRVELEREFSFQSQSDTEVILYAYKKYGRDCVQKIDGIFAFAIWDRRDRSFFVARDRMGVKPLYYFSNAKTFAFSSEIKSLFIHDIPRTIDGDAINIFFQLLYIPEPQTPFTEVKKLPAAHYLVRTADGKVTIKKYWQVEDTVSGAPLSRHEAIKKIRSTFDAAVAEQLVSDRPVGVFLSGGIDSTAVLGSVCRSVTTPVKTFSVGFAVTEQFEKFNSDFLLARKTAAHYGTDHTELLIGPNDIWSEIQKISWHLDEPNFNPTAGAIYLLSREAKKSVAVVLGGDGADELFGGYPRYRASQYISYFQKLPRFLQKSTISILRSGGKTSVGDLLSLPPGAERIARFLCVPEETTRSVFTAEQYRRGLALQHLQNRYFNKNTDISDFENVSMNIDRQSWLVDESLLRSDKMTMANGLEERVPILDRRLVELAYHLPSKVKMPLQLGSLRSFQGKQLWRDAVKDYLPKHVLNQQKRGWFTPMAKWLRAELHDPVRSVLEELEPTWFNRQAALALFDDHVAGRRYNLNTIWALVMWQLWYNQNIKNIDRKV